MKKGEEGRLCDALKLHCTPVSCQNLSGAPERSQDVMGLCLAWVGLPGGLDGVQAMPVRHEVQHRDHDQRQPARSVGELAQLCGCSSANISRHLTLLTQRGLVVRQSRGNTAIYSMADPSVYALCDLVCGNIAKRFERQAKASRSG